MSSERYAMSGTDLAIVAVIIVLIAIVVLKMTVFKGPKWLRDQQKAEQAKEREHAQKSTCETSNAKEQNHG